ncbi:hypothetical protein KC614_02360 [candidate division WWE3 bacterium]|uniref:Cell wall-active antibiotics response LiaF-like C-terminal domain-containing protein n=1 Tax=candidate division WWE3 bacterium TaxID=2053526 RepID=A0A955LK71_UNCKA|nr:hypothetical protein [candidate division WWE3 bacterium]
MQEGSGSNQENKSDNTGGSVGGGASFEDRADMFAQRVEESAERFGNRMEKQFEPYKRSGNVVWALFLIFIGVMFLLNSTGVVGWNVWAYLWRFWPLFIVLAGVQILVGRSRAAGALVSIFAVLVLLCVGFMSLLAVRSTVVTDWNVRLPQWFLDVVSQTNGVGDELSQEATVEVDAFENVESRDLVLDVGLAEFTLVDQDVEDYLHYDAQFYQNFGGPLLDRSFTNNKLSLKFKQMDQHSSVGVSKSPTYNFTLGAVDVPTSFDFTVGAGSGEVDLTKVKVNDLYIDIGAGQMDLTLSDKSIPSDFKIEIGAGKFVLTLPKTVGFKLNYSVGVGSINVGEENIASIGKDDVYRSDNYDKTDLKVTISAEVGVGQLKIETK